MSTPSLETHSERQRRFGTFGGVFTPTLLTILGVIMYLREGWVIGNAGVLGGLIIILLAYIITICTALSMSSITSNLRIGAGGAYAIISQSLGLEIGGSLGIPRYLSQALAITLYIFGFREAWLWVFPGHSGFLVDLVVFLVLWGIAYKSADLAIRVQYFVMAVIGASLLSILIGAISGSMEYDLLHIGLWGDFPGAPETDFSGTSFWIVFAVFFPAATGIMAGANMSGDLKDPRRSIAKGTLAAILVSLVIYLLLGYWIVRSATSEELLENYYVMVDKAYWGPAVIAGIFGATFSSALSSMVGSARILQAMGEHRVVFRSSWVGQLTAKSEPRNSMLVTGAIVFLAMLVRDLNAIAPLITIFFMVTYAMLNVVVIVEHQLELISFRPLLRIPRFVPVIGLIGSVFAMFIINPIVSLISAAVVIVFYLYLTHRQIDAPFEDVRSGLFISFSEWAAKKVVALPDQRERAWKPKLLIPVGDPAIMRGSFSLIETITGTKGSVKLIGIRNDRTPEKFESQIQLVSRTYRDRGVFSAYTILDHDSFLEGVILGMQALGGSFFKPNILFLDMPRTEEQETNYNSVLSAASKTGLGALIYAPHPQAALGHRNVINVWIRDRSPNWQLSWNVGNLDLSILTAYMLSTNWNATLRLLTVVRFKEDLPKAKTFMERLVDLARLPEPEIEVAHGDFSVHVKKAPQADMSLFGLGDEADFELIRNLIEQTGSSCLFVRDSGHENVFA